MGNQNCFNSNASSNEKETLFLGLKSPETSNPKTPSFSPFLAKTCEVEGASGFCPGTVCFSPRHNMIIACPMDDTMRFYDATTLLPVKGRETLELDCSVMQMSFHAETDTYLLGCSSQFIYLYDASNNELKKLRECEEQMAAVTFLNSTYYAFSEMDSNRLYIGNLENEDVETFDSPNGDVFSLYHLTQQNLLLAGLDDGTIVIYHTENLPQLPILCSVQAHQGGVTSIEGINVNGKEFILTASSDCTVKIWQLVKEGGTMKLLRVISIRSTPYSVVYLENYRMIAISFESNDIEFWSFTSGKLERKISRKKNDDGHSLFVMKEKNMVGVASYNDNVIEFFQLSPQEGEKKN